jgi:hypothetical protein
MEEACGRARDEEIEETAIRFDALLSIPSS